jgi:hypothetical protein
MSNTVIRTATPVAASRRRWKRWLIGGVVAASALAILLYLGFEYSRDHDVVDAIAEADRLDPGWRFADLEAARAPIADAENSALTTQAAFAKIPPKWLAPPPNGAPGLVDRLESVPLPQRPGEQELQELHTALEQAAEALALAQQLADMPRGRYAVAWAPDLIGTLMPHVHNCRDVARLLILDALARSVDGDGDGAVRSCRAAANVGRSIGDEPVAISQVVRRVCVTQAVHALEGILARTTASAGSLEEMQKLLTVESAEPSLLIAARGDRAIQFQPLELMRTGQFNRATYKMRPSWMGDRADGWRDGSTARGAEAAYLRYWTAYVEIVKMPTEIQEDRLAQLVEPNAPLPPLLAGLTGKANLPRMARGFHIAQARQRCAAAALAAERYRIAQGHWPDSAKALVPAYLADLPCDPFDGQPVRVKRKADGLVVYSVGPDRVDDGGKLDRDQPEAPGTDLGFQLWDPARRGVPAARD